jgi:hypothetical protein
VEGFQRHLGCRLTDRLGSNRPACLAGLDDCPLVSLPNKADKRIKLALSEMVEIASECGIVMLKGRYLGCDVTEELPQRFDELE